VTVTDEGKIHVSPALQHAGIDHTGHSHGDDLLDRFTVCERLTAIEADIARILKVMESTEGVIRKVAEEVMPTVESLAKSPMIKALGFGGRNKA
jgi:hypothetical protein